MARKESLPREPLSTRLDPVGKFYGANLAEVFRTPLYDCSLKNVSGVPDLALTRLKGGLRQSGGVNTHAARFLSKYPNADSFNHTNRSHPNVWRPGGGVARNRRWTQYRRGSESR